MEWFKAVLNIVGEIFNWFFIINPWERAIRVRIGKHIKKIDPGIHFKIPFFDRVFKQSIRLRICAVKSQSVTTTDGHTLTVAGAIEYSINDILPLYNTINNPEETINQTVQSLVSKYIAENTLERCKPKDVMAYVNSNLNLDQWGLSSSRYLLTDFAIVKTYRIITGEIYKWFDEQLRMENLN